MQKDPNTSRDLHELFSNVELVIFDVDDTILKDTHVLYWKHLNIATLKHNKTSWTDENFHHYFRQQEFTTRIHLVAKMLNEDPLKPTDLAYLATESFYRSFDTDKNKAELFSSITHLIFALHEAGIPQIAFSNTEAKLINKMLTDHKLDQYFLTIVGEAKKPNPHILFETLSRYAPQIPTQNMVIIGDSLRCDGQLAKNAECSFIYFSNGDENKYSDFIAAQKAGKIPNCSFFIKHHAELLVALECVSKERNLRSLTF